MAGFGVQHRSGLGLKVVRGRLDGKERALGDFSTPLMETGLWLGARATEELDAREVSSPFYGGRITKGILARSIHTIIRPNKQAAVTSTNTKYARLQQLGGLQKPTGGRKSISIPVDRRAASLGLWPRDYPDGELDFVPTPGGGNTVGWLVEHADAVRKADKYRRAAARSAAKRASKVNRIRKKSSTVIKKLDIKRRKLLKRAKRAKGRARVLLVRELAGMLSRRRRLLSVKARGISRIYRNADRPKRDIGRRVFLLVRSARIIGRRYLYVDERARRFAVQRGLKHLEQF